VDAFTDGKAVVIAKDSADLINLCLDNQIHSEQDMTEWYIIDKDETHGVMWEENNWEWTTFEMYFRDHKVPYKVLFCDEFVTIAVQMKYWIIANGRGPLCV
jgi:hypothetical protein